MLLSVLALIDGALTIIKQNNPNEVHLSDGSVFQSTAFDQVLETTNRLLDRAVLRKLRNSPADPVPQAILDAHKAAETDSTKAEIVDAPEAEPIPTEKDAHNSRVVLGFGKYKGAILANITQTDRDWIKWMFANCVLKVENNRLLAIYPDKVTA